MKILVIVAATLAMLQESPSNEVQHEVVDQSVAKPVAVKVVETKPKKITDKKHPDYIRCRIKSVIGSLAKKKRICMTNSEWIAVNSESSKRSRELVEDLAVGMNNNGMWAVLALSGNR